MRVTHQMIGTNMLTHLNTQRQRMETLQSQISSGLRVTKASEDPIAGADVMRLQSRLQVLDQWDKNLVDGKTWLRETETSLNRITELITKARELSVQGANGTLNDQDRQALAVEVDAILEDLVTLFNSRQSDGALYGGFETAGDPFFLNMATGAVTYFGDSGEMQRDVGPGITIPVNLHGNRFANWASPTNPLTVVWQLAQDLRTPQNSGTPAAMAANLANLDQSLRTVLSLRAEVGAKEKRLEQLDTHNKDTYFRLNDLLVQAQGTDMEKAIIDLNSAETTYRAALQVGARIIPPTLADFLR